jgi:hypothetical protein
MARRILLACSLAATACATVPEPGGGGDSLPNASAGPFRALLASELSGDHAAPNAVDDSHTFARDPSVIDADGDPSTLAVIGYFGAGIGVSGGKDPAPTDPTRAIIRLDALDARSFDGAAEMVLAPTDAWEGGVIGEPHALRAGGEIFLYYAAAGGIGLAKSGDGHAFTRVPGPVLGPAASGWDSGAVPKGPGVVQLANGSFRMFYEAAGSIGAASSPDGVTWTRAAAPALAHNPGSGAEPTDYASLGSPFPVLAASADGRAELRLYHGAMDAQGHGVIGLAASYGEDGPLVPAAAPVFGSDKALGPREPCVLVYPGFTLLFATEKPKATMDYPAVAAGLAPATATLPAPNPP